MSSKKKETNQDQFESVENALSKTEHYIEENQKSLTIIVLAIILIVGGYGPVPIIPSITSCV